MTAPFLIRRNNTLHAVKINSNINVGSLTGKKKWIGNVQPLY